MTRLRPWMRNVLPLGIGMALSSLSPAIALAQTAETSPASATNATIEGANLQGSSNAENIRINELLTQISTDPLTASPAPAEEGMDPVEAQVTSVSNLTDVQPTDWAYQALSRLIERYGCIAGYPDGTFRGNRALTRYEFAAGLNACLDQFAESIGGGSTDDLESLRRLQQEFASELATLRGRVDLLEARVTELQENQFSTTTRLFGQAILGIQGRFDNTADFFPVDGVPDTEDPSTQVNLITNYQLSLLTQFSRRSLLLVGLQAGDGSTAPRLSNDSRLAYEGDTNNNLVLSDLTFRQLIGDNLALIVGTAGVNGVNVFRGANRIEGAGSGPLSAFAQRNPIVSIGSGRGGFGVDWQIAPRISFQAVYSSSLPNDPALGGLFGSRAGDTTIGTQLTLAPSDTVDVTLNYINSYSPSGSLRTGVGDDQLTAGAPLNTDAIGATVSWRVTPGLTLGAWGGYTNSQIPGEAGSVETTNWMAFVNFPDLFGEGNMGGIYVGQPPKIIDSDLPLGQNIPDRLAGGLGAAGDQPGTTTHVEVFYRYQLSDNISITPGVIVVFNPGHTSGSDTVVIGALRTTFRF